MKLAKQDPVIPFRADYRIIRKLIDSSYKVVHLPEEYDLIVSVFGRAGGSWEALFRGDIDQIRLLKKVIKVAYRKNHLTKAPSWTEGSGKVTDG